MHHHRVSPERSRSCMVTTGKFHEVTDPIKIDLAFKEPSGSLPPKQLCTHPRIAAILLPHSAVVHLGGQIRHRASLAVMISICSLLAPRGLAQPLCVTRCALSHLVNSPELEIESRSLLSTQGFIPVNQAGWSLCLWHWSHTLSSNLPHVALTGL